MFETAPWLSTLISLPLLAACILFSITGSPENVARNARAVAFWASFVTFLTSFYLMLNLSSSESELAFQERIVIMPSLQLSYGLGVDSLSLSCIVLCSFLVMLGIWSSWSSVTHHVREYMALFLVLESCAIGTFAATDLLLFYVFFEMLLIPLFFIVGIWGESGRREAVLKFFLQSIWGTSFFLIAILYINNVTGTFDIAQITLYHFSKKAQAWLWIAFFMAFAVKTALWPFHTWLPDAHAAAPTAGSIMLTGVLLQAGAYGFMRLSLPFFPDASELFRPLLLSLGGIGFISSTLCTAAQKDLKRLAAYMSIANISLVVLGVALMTQASLEGAIFHMLAHGLLTAMLFICIGFLTERLSASELVFCESLALRMPLFTLAFCTFILGSLGLPGSCGFVGKFVILAELTKTHPWLATVVCFGTLIAMFYCLDVGRRVLFVPPKASVFQGENDLNQREGYLVFPLMVLSILGGLFSTPVSHLIGTGVTHRIQEIYRKKGPSSLSEEEPFFKNSTDIRSKSDG